MPKWGWSLKLSFFTLCFGAFLDWMSYGLVYPIFAVSIFHQDPVFLAGTHNALRGFWLGVMLAASPLGQFFASPFIGTLSDQIGRKRTLQLTALIIVAGYLLSAFGIWEKSLSLVIIGRVITGIGAGNISIINSAVADLSTADRKARNFALITMANGLGFTAGPFIGGKLSAWGYGVPFVFASLLTMLGFFFYTFFFIETHSKKKLGWTGLSSRLLHLKKMVSSSKFHILFLAFAVFCFGWSFYWEFIPVTWITIYGLNASQIGNFYAYGSAVYVLSSGILIRPFVNKFKALPILLFSWVALGLCSFLLLYGELGLFWAGIPIQQFLVALIFPIGTTIVSNAVSENHQGEILGAFQSLQSFAFAVTPFLGGILLQLSYNIPLILSGIAMFLAFLILFMGRHRVTLREKHQK